MKTDLTTPGSLLQSQARAKDAAAKAPVGKLDPEALAEKLKGKIPKPNPDYKLDLSAPKAPSLSLPSTPSTPSPKLPDLPSEPTPKNPAKDLVENKLKDEVKEIKKVTEPKVKEGTLQKPVVIFVKGLDIFSSPSKSERGYAGVGRMAESIEGSRIYGWDQKDEIIEEIKKADRRFPVILVGHSLGGDTAVEVADELDSLDHQFRAVDLLITIDSVGADNDIVPQNVKKHLNVFGENDFFLNDGPHVARRHERTEVKNILSPYDHTELDDDREIQFEVVSMIQDTLSKRPLSNS